MMRRTKLSLADFRTQWLALEGQSLAGFQAIKVLLGDPENNEKLFLRQLNSLFKNLSLNFSSQMAQFASSEIGSLLITNGYSASAALDAYKAMLTSIEQQGLNLLHHKEQSNSQVLLILIKMGDNRAMSLAKNTVRFAAKQEAQKLSAQAKERDLKFLIEAEFHTKPEIQQLIKARYKVGIRGALAEELAKMRVAKRYQAMAGVQKVIGNLECLRLHTDTPARTINEWLGLQTQQRGYQDMAEMRQQAPNKVSKLLRQTAQLRESDIQLWHSVTELDIVVHEVVKEGKPKIIELQQVKSGAGDTHAQAAAQNERGLTVLRKIAAGKPAYALFDSPSKNVLGVNLSRAFDLSNLDILTTTVGPRGKTSFTEQFEQTAEDLMDMAQMIIDLFANTDDTNNEQSDS